MHDVVLLPFDVETYGRKLAEKDDVGDDGEGCRCQEAFGGGGD